MNATLIQRLLLIALGALFVASALYAAERKAKFDPRDLNGAWDRYPDSSGRVDPTVAPRAPDIPPPPLRAEYKSAYEAQQKAVAAANARGEPPATNYTHCLPDGMPAVMAAMFPLEVIQSPNRVTIIEEAYNQVRRIYLNEEQIPIEDAEPGFWGHSVGRWEGDVLLVDTVGIKENVRFRNAPHSAQMRISERIRLLSPNIFEDRITVVDPVYLTEPWTWTWQYQRKPGYKLYEYVCEDNREFADPITGAQRVQVRPIEPTQ